jgi:Tfp pilus assembly pilus retraction ATPase PilT
MQTGQKVGMQTLDMALQELVRRNVVTMDEAQSKTNTPNLFAHPEETSSGNGSTSRLGSLIR